MERNVPTRLHIGFFGRRNAGKSTLVNALAGQKISIVSEIAGTTTDPVRKTMELPKLGPVVLIDTAGIDDEGSLGALRAARSREVLRECDLAVLCVDKGSGIGEAERMLMRDFSKRKIPFLLAYTKIDLMSAEERSGEAQAVFRDERAEGEGKERGGKYREKKSAEKCLGEKSAAGGEDAAAIVCCSALYEDGISALRRALEKVFSGKREERPLLFDLVGAGKTAVLVCPIDSSAPKGRLILPQQMAVRELLDHFSIPLLCRPESLSEVLGKLKAPPALVVTDSQSFSRVSELTPKELPLTSFSILLARKRGILSPALRASEILDQLEDGDRILISEGCTHQRQCGDIGSVQLPRLLKGYTGKELCFFFSSGRSFPEKSELSGFRLLIHCGACMLNERELLSRFSDCEEAGLPATNYGIAIAKMKGILKRAVSSLGDARH